MVDLYHHDFYEIEGVKMGAFIIQIDVENPECLDHFFMDK
jgi:hypothetical protein